MTHPTTPLPRRLWRELERPTAEAFATWSRGVFLDQLVPVLQRLFDAAEAGERCWIGDHEALVAENQALRVQVAALQGQLDRYAAVEPPGSPPPPPRDVLNAPLLPDPTVPTIEGPA